MSSEQPATAEREPDARRVDAFWQPVRACQGLFRWAAALGVFGLITLWLWVAAEQVGVLDLWLIVVRLTVFVFAPCAEGSMLWLLVRGAALDRAAKGLNFPDGLCHLVEVCPEPSSALPAEALNRYADALVSAATLADETELAGARAYAGFIRRIVWQSGQPGLLALRRGMLVVAAHCGIAGLEDAARSSISDQFRADRGGLLAGVARDYLRTVSGEAVEASELPRDDEERALAAFDAARRGSARQKQQAEQQLRATGGTAAAVLAGRFAAAVGRRRAARRVRNAAAAVLVLALMVGFASGRFNPQTIDVTDSWTYPLAASIALSLLTLLASDAMARASGTRLLIATAERRTIGPLLDVLAQPRSRATVEARIVLLRLLPELRASDAALLNDAHHACLRGVLKTDDRWFILAVLKAFEQVGGEAEIKAVAALAAGRGVARQSRVVRAAAQECLGYLQARVEAERPGRTLVRAVSTAPDAEATLVRPAGNAAGEQLLVRPVVRGTGNAD